MFQLLNFNSISISIIAVKKFSISMSILIVDPSVKLDLCMCNAYGNGTRSCLPVSLLVKLDTYDCPVGGNVLVQIQGRANKHDICSECYLLGSLLKL